MANYQAYSNLGGNHPTGGDGIVNGCSNPSFVPVSPGLAVTDGNGGGPYQQINVGDILTQIAGDSTYDNLEVAVPASSNPTALGETGSSAAATSLLAMKAIHDSYVGRSLQYRNPNNTGHGTPQDRISVATGRVKAKILSTDYNYGTYLPAGTLVGAAVAVAGSSSSWTIASVDPAAIQTTSLSKAGTGGAGASTALTAEYAIGRLACDKAANDKYVYVDEISTVLAGGPQNAATA